MCVQYILVIFENQDVELTDPFEEGHKLSVNFLFKKEMC